MSEENLSTRYIGYIENGVNLDHIIPGNALKIITVLNLYKFAIGVGLNLHSDKMQTKDLIKIENFNFSADALKKINIFSIGATLSIIKNYKVIDKFKIATPEIIHSIIICPNHRCISSCCESKFFVTMNRYQEVQICCFFCEQIFLLKDIKRYNLTN